MLTKAGTVVVLILALVLQFGSAQAQSQKQKAAPDIVETAMAAGSFDTLVMALQKAGLVETLKGPGPFTVFAPTDEAFAKLPQGALNDLLMNKEKLKSVLTYHVVQGMMPASKVMKEKSIVTVNGRPLAIRVSGDKVMADNAQVVKTDIMAGNGVIHVVDSVLMPMEKGTTRQHF